MKMTKHILHTLGWIGACASLGAYFLVTLEVLKPQNFWYQLLNLIGALGLGTICYYKKAHQPLVVNIIWFAIAFISIASIAISYIRA